VAILDTVGEEDGRTTLYVRRNIAMEVKEEVWGERVSMYIYAIIYATLIVTRTMFGLGGSKF
jgi:hypothetical protein